MAGTKGKKSRKSLRYFYLDGHLHRLLRVVKPRDLLYAWDYIDKKRKLYVWSDAQRRLQHAYTITQVAKMMNRHRQRVVEYMEDGSLRRPQQIYNLTTGKPSKYFFSEDDVLEVHDHFVNLHRGRPRNDGLIIPQAMPSREELKALMRYDSMVYIQDDDGNFIPIWQENIW